SPRHGGTLQALAAVDGCALSPLTLPKGVRLSQRPAVRRVCIQEVMEPASALASMKKVQAKSMEKEPSQ
ncbi:hypothetical protein NNX13_22105, partial [Pseudomonas sp. Eb3]|uniref:hypothetical protein n=1 Tax=Pseudomonas sp. Eb3 TaxID=1327558 RepID=UPI002107483B